MLAGICRLCMQPCELQDSHYLSAGFYRIIDEGAEPGEQPVVINRENAVFSSAQARAHLLCSGCEQRFNRNGEDWVLDNCWRSADRFSLRTVLLSAEAIINEPHFRAFNGRSIVGVDVDKLVYFGVSVFWRGGVHDWRLGKGEPDRLEIGPYAEPLRLYLLGGPFPANVTITVSVVGELDERLNRNIALPWCARRNTTERLFKFIVPGLVFWMMTGRGIHAEFKRMSTAHSGFVYMASSSDEAVGRYMFGLIKNTQRRGKLRVTPPRR